tara:strand:- start:8 stop:409 length:402 start_codon:yes stop_codon:yes gene_type:complete
MSSDKTTAKDFCLVRGNLVKNIPQKTWIRYITKDDMIVHKGGMLLKNNSDNKKESFLLLKSPYGPMWRVNPNENYIYVDKSVITNMKDKTNKVTKNKKVNKIPTTKKDVKKIDIQKKKKKYTKKTKIIKVNLN